MSDITITFNLDAQDRLKASYGNEHGIDIQAVALDLVVILKVAGYQKGDVFEMLNILWDSTRLEEPPQH